MSAARSAIASIGEIYRLTPGEIRELHAEVGGIRDIAEVLTVSPPTVKTHLHRPTSARADDNRLQSMSREVVVTRRFHARS